MTDYNESTDFEQQPDLPAADLWRLVKDGVQGFAERPYFMDWEQR